MTQKDNIHPSRKKLQSVTNAHTEAVEKHTSKWIPYALRIYDEWRTYMYNAVIKRLIPHLLFLNSYSKLFLNASLDYQPVLKSSPHQQNCRDVAN